MIHGPSNVKFLKLIICVRSGHCDYLPEATKNIAAPLTEKGVGQHLNSRKNVNSAPSIYNTTLCPLHDALRAAL